MTCPSDARKAVHVSGEKRSRTKFANPNRSRGASTARSHTRPFPARVICPRHGTPSALLAPSYTSEYAFQDPERRQNVDYAVLAPRAPGVDHETSQRLPHRRRDLVMTAPGCDLRFANVNGSKLSSIAKSEGSLQDLDGAVAGWPPRPAESNCGRWSPGILSECRESILAASAHEGSRLNRATAWSRSGRLQCDVLRA